MEDFAHHKLTIAQIAAKAGVSIPTVSKVINHRSDVAQSTRERVERVIAEHGYATNRVAISLKKERIGLIHLIVPSLSTPYSFEVMRGVEDALETLNRRLVISSASTGESRNAQHWINTVIDGSIEGVLLVLADSTLHHLDELRTHQVPFVVIDRLGELGPDIPSVSATNWSAGRTATQHLLSLGHRHIAAILGQAGFAGTRDRLAGYRAALEEVGIPLDSSLVSYGPFTVDAGYELAAKQLELPQPPTAILTGSDDQALGIYRLMHERGIDVPDEMSIIGFDDTLLSAQSTPPLTTIRQPLFEMGRIASTMLLRLIEGKPLDGTRVELATPLIERASCAPRRKARVVWNISTTKENMQWPLKQAKEA
jgi:DNA-binding LacI/PurR family transcriptional regulator